MRALGIVLAAGAGRRMGAPKALLRGPDGRTWVARAAQALRAGGCAEVAVTLGAAAPDVLAELPPGVTGLAVPDWAEGVGAGVRAALEHAAAGGADVLVLVPVDLPGLSADDVAAVLAAAAAAPEPAAVRATDGGRPGHPVALGRGHWAAALAATGGDTGLRAFLDGVGVREVPRAGAVADVDSPAGLPPGTLLPPPHA
ncbi:nucleotidyltransferase family protein [Kineococcus rubinsiae]|uniref:nucleotidyltransferase family protein n=1 Tax=Kineococcus rubinsiae TaxID=2609562 RepID=UPI00143016E0|nr:NTP transferase domain-containing protein [Kineococcus rubinsiae]NIZ90776.1 NTP transferase domain-containing protein [Kineococcus rubinsiae]